MSIIRETKIASPTISACMIVKNEEEFLPKCLESIRDYVDEIVIVDTGSTDSSLEIATSYGARIYHHPWEDHFSKHRNQSFSYAKGDWILYIDADEELLPGSGGALSETVTAAEGNVDAIAVVLECIFDDGKSMAYNNAIRVFRNHRGFYFKGRVHNYIVGVKNALCSPIHLFHHGYNLNEEGRKRKFERTTKLLKMDIADDPSDPRPHHFLSASYLSEKMAGEALDEARKALSLYERKEALYHNYYWSLYIAASACLRLGKREEARLLAEKGVKIYPNHLDSHYILSLVAYENHDRSVFEHHFENYLRIKEAFHKNPEQFGEMVHNSLGSQWQLHLLRSFLLMDDGMERPAQKETESAMVLCPDPYLLHLRLGNHHLNCGRFVDSEEHFLKAAEARPNESAPRKNLAFVYEKLGRYEAWASQLEQALQIDASDFDVWFALGMSHLKVGRFGRAERAFHEAGVLKPDNTNAAINRALCLNESARFEEAKALLEKVHCHDHALKIPLLSNLAFSCLGAGCLEEAVEALNELERLDPASLEPPVFLSRVYLEQKDLEACALQCEKILQRLGISESLVIDCIEDLGYLYLRAAKELSLLTNTIRLARVCLDISLALSNNHPALVVEIGSLLMGVGSITLGAETLKHALRIAPSDEKIREQVSRFIHSLPSHVSPSPTAPPLSNQCTSGKT